MSLIDYLQTRQQQSLDELIELLEIPSVSTDSARKEDVVACAKRVEAHMKDAGLSAEVISTKKHPIVYGERLSAPGKPTLLIYGHYDVQPPEPLELWRHGPFTPTIEDGFLIARGSSDDKGQMFSLLKGVQASIETHGEAPVNVKMLIEGEEEIGSPNLGPFIESERKRLACDVAVISDSSQYHMDVPAITYGLKGLCYLELVVRGPRADLHSGSFGGSVANPANTLAAVITGLTDDGRIAIPGFYDDVVPLEEWERKEWAALDFSDTAYLASLGSPATFGEPGYTTLERRWGRPTLDVNGLYSGFTGEGAKTVLPSEARAKFSMRLVPNQSSKKIEKLTREYVKSIAPDTVHVEVIDHHGAEPVVVSREGKAMDAAVVAMETAFGRKPVFIREGGSIPVVHTFKQVLGVDTLLLGLGLPDDGAHSPNERFRVRDFHRGALMMATLLDELAK